MDRDLRTLLAGAATFVVAVVVGGSLVRAGLLAAEPAAAVSLGLILALVIVVVVATARSRRWLSNPYW